MLTLADDRSLIIKKAGKGSTVVAWDCNGYIFEAEKQIGGDKVDRDLPFNEKILQDLVGTSNRLFQNLKSKGKITAKKLKCFNFELKKAANLC